MTPIPFLSPVAATSVLPGAVPAVATAGIDFASLLPSGFAPVMPRQGDAEGGKDLPASEDDALPIAAEAAAWIAPPIWRAICPPVTVPSAGEDSLAAATGIVSTAVVAPPAASLVPDVHLGTDRPETTTHVSREGDAKPVEAPRSFRPVFPRVIQPGAVEELAATERQIIAPPVQGGAPIASAAAAITVTMPTTAADRGALTSAMTQTPMAIVGGSSETSTLASMIVAGEDVATAPATRAETPGKIIARVSTEASPPLRATIAKDAAIPAVAPVPVQPTDLSQPTRVAPAAQVFAAAIQQVVRDERRLDSPEPAIASIAPTTDLAAHAVAAAENSRHAALDMARETWPAKMIERIEMMRDAMDAVDTSIRLVPDKLGTIDVSLKQDGDTVAVQFTAQQPDTRQLLAEAQPKLAELAEAKGLKLSAQTSDGGQQQQQQRAPAAAPQTTRPVRAASHDDAAAADERIA